MSRLGASVSCSPTVSFWSSSTPPTVEAYVCTERAWPSTVSRTDLSIDSQADAAGDQPEEDQREQADAQRVPDRVPAGGGLLRGRLGALQQGDGTAALGVLPGRVGGLAGGVPRRLDRRAGSAFQAASGAQPGVAFQPEVAARGSARPGRRPAARGAVARVAAAARGCGRGPAGAGVAGAPGRRRVPARVRAPGRTGVLAPGRPPSRPGPAATFQAASGSCQAPSALQTVSVRSETGRRPGPLRAAGLLLEPGPGGPGSGGVHCGRSDDRRGPLWIAHSGRMVSVCARCR